MVKGSGGRGAGAKTGTAAKCCESSSSSRCTCSLMDPVEEYYDLLFQDIDRSSFRVSEKTSRRNK